MFYIPKDGHNLPHNPFAALIAPRPIGWISSQDGAGNINLAPFSFFNAVAYDPPQVMFSITGDPNRDKAHKGEKDSLRNIRETGEFTVSMATYALREAVNKTSVAAPSNIDEFEYAGLGKRACQVVTPPAVAESPIHLECKLVHIQQLPSSVENSPNNAVFGEVVGIHIDDHCLKDGIVDLETIQPIARLGYKDFSELGTIFQLQRPKWPDVNSPD